MYIHNLAIRIMKVNKQVCATTENPHLSRLDPIASLSTERLLFLQLLLQLVGGIQCSGNVVLTAHPIYSAT